MRLSNGDFIKSALNRRVPTCVARSCRVVTWSDAVPGRHMEYFHTFGNFSASVCTYVLNGVNYQCSGKSCVLATPLGLVYNPGTYQCLLRHQMWCLFVMLRLRLGLLSQLNQELRWDLMM